MGAFLTAGFALLRGALPLVGGFFTGGLSGVWSILAAVAGTEWGSKILIALAFLVGGWIWGFSHEHAVKTREVAAAVQSRDVEWGKTIADANAASEQRIKEALDAARKTSPTPPAGTDLVELCRNSPSCRSAFAQRRILQAPKGHVGG